MFKVGTIVRLRPQYYNRYPHRSNTTFTVVSCDKEYCYIKDNSVDMEYGIYFKSYRLEIVPIQLEFKFMVGA